MALSIEDFAQRLTRGTRKITFAFPESFFSIVGKTGVSMDRFKNIRNTVKNVGHRRGIKLSENSEEYENLFFDVEVVIVKVNGTCFVTSFKELATGPFSGAAEIAGYGADMIDTQKAKFQVESFFIQKSE